MLSISKLVCNAVCLYIRILWYNLLCIEDIWGRGVCRPSYLGCGQFASTEAAVGFPFLLFVYFNS